VSYDPEWFGQHRAAERVCATRTGQHARADKTRRNDAARAASTTPSVAVESPVKKHDRVPARFGGAGNQRATQQIEKLVVGHRSLSQSRRRWLNARDWAVRTAPGERPKTRAVSWALNPTITRNSKSSRSLALNFP
jgi:hypothetical protein